MWILEGISEAAKGIKVFLSRAKGSYTVGRLGTSDIVVDFDKSVSRTHATLRVSATRLEFVDGGSRLGSFINSARVPNANPVELKDGDELRLGAGLSVFRIKHKPVVIVFSGVKSSVKDDLSARAEALGFKVSKDFEPECTHLVMTSLKITMKTVQAVAHGTHIVTDVWLKTLDANSKTSPYTYPNEIDYTPAVKEENMTGEQFIPNPRRKQLFENHQFLFFDKEDIDIFSPVVSACAGTVVDCTDITDSKSDIISVVKQNKSPFVVALDPDDERFKDVVSDVNTKDSIIYSLLYATLDDHLKLSTLIPQHEATPLEPTPAPAPVLAGNFNGGNNCCNNDDDDDDDDDLFQDLFKKKGASTKTKSEHTQVPQTQQRKTQQPFYVQSVISQVEASLVDPTQQLFPSTAASSSSNVPESIPSKQSNLLASRLGFTSTPAVKPPPPVTIPSTATVKVTAPAALPKPTQAFPQQIAIPIPQLKQPTVARAPSNLSKQTQVKTSASQLLKVTERPAYTIEDNADTAMSQNIEEVEDEIEPNSVILENVVVADSPPPPQHRHGNSNSTTKRSIEVDTEQDDAVFPAAKKPKVAVASGASALEVVGLPVPKKALPKPDTKAVGKGKEKEVAVAPPPRQFKNGAKLIMASKKEGSGSCARDEGTQKESEVKEEDEDEFVDGGVVVEEMDGMIVVPDKGKAPVTVYTGQNYKPFRKNLPGIVQIQRRPIAMELV